jgi:hypothetical protein
MFTPYSHLSDDELTLAVANKENPTDLEIELTERLHQLQENIASLTMGSRSSYTLPETKYVPE